MCDAEDLVEELQSELDEVKKKLERLGIMAGDGVWWCIAAPILRRMKARRWGQHFHTTEAEDIEGLIDAFSAWEANS